MEEGPGAAVRSTREFPCAIRDSANKAEGDIGGDLHHQLLTAFRNLDFLAGGLAASGANPHPRGAAT